ncbi:V-type proton ATPase subunit E-like [Sycon ciliatum]|uniref:V-type proton ATPase subunit E-like n=1 Tax=Sycon ciliatum TaxID=27933 RepID=UPI0020A8B060|eukprot:scpid74346/ scgid27450/ V-type proton ATPase subunit E; V-ATPase 26 kDa subunit; Vacuolar proton pump subunit E
MAVSDQDVEKQIRHMMAFIEQEAKEKAEEIDAKAEEEFNIEKGRLVQNEKLKVMGFYEKKEKALELQKKIQRSNLLNQSRLQVLKSRDDHVKGLLEETRRRLAEITSSPARYDKFLEDCITQGLCQLLEPAVIVRCRRDDVDRVKKVMSKSQSEYTRITKGKKCTVAVDSSFLPADSSGGVELYSKDGKIKVANTLESRLEMVSSQMLPQIRTALFGKNPNRKFDD